MLKIMDINTPIIWFWENNQPFYVIKINIYQSYLLDMDIERPQDLLELMDAAKSGDLVENVENFRRLQFAWSRMRSENKIWKSKIKSLISIRFKNSKSGA